MMKKDHAMHKIPSQLLANLVSGTILISQEAVYRIIANDGAMVHLEEIDANKYEESHPHICQICVQKLEDSFNIRSKDNDIIGK